MVPLRSNAGIKEYLILSKKLHGSFCCRSNSSGGSSDILHY
jgi:hypothetical protein